ncbi:MAG: hypothetical protein JWM19_7593, partial [Actinomycetia bacterium]|nr:hypothetical protein [Actinomycetes bacterium]
MTSGGAAVAVAAGTVFATDGGDALDALSA